jgi:proteasome assembly chaperone (PAC2) family protein
MDYIELHREVPSNLTTMVIAFGGWIDAGEAATGAMRYLVRQLAAPRVASIDAEPFFIFTQERPTVRMTEEGNRVIRWPRSDFYAWQPPGGEPGLLLFRGMEPNQMWRTYSNAFLSLAEQCGVKRIVSIGALLAGNPHTRPTRVTGRSTDSAWQALLEDWGIYRPSRYQGPTGISTILLEAAAQRGMTSLSFMGQAPHYLQGASNPSVIQALLTHVNRLLDLGLDVSQLDPAVEAFRTKCDRLIADNATTLAHVRQLEQEYDAEVTPEPRSLRDEELNADKLMQELEEFLREEREGGN